MNTIELVFPQDIEALSFHFLRLTIFIYVCNRLV